MQKTHAVSYVCGFARVFTIRESVLLLKKKRPEWQRGLLNGVGGKVEPTDESVLAAMHREWREETGIQANLEWRLFCSIHYAETRVVVHFFETDAPTVIAALDGECNDVGERFVVTTFFSAITSADVVPNLKWLLPLAFRDQENLMTVAVDQPKDVR